MLLRFLIPVSAVLATVAPCHAAENFQWADIVVYGDSPSALSASIELAESGHDVLLVSPVAHVGGMMIEGLGNQDVDSRSGSGAPIGGLAAEFYLRVARAYSPGTNSPRYSFEAKVAQTVIDGWLAEKSVRQLRSARISETPGAVSKSGGRITSFLLENGTRIAGRMFIDGTVEGDLMAAAGVTNTHGREGNAAYGENVGGVLNPTSKDQYDVSVDPYVVPGNPSSGVITGVQNEAVGVHGSADDAEMGFCLRLPLTKNPANKIPITAPAGYDPKDYELYRRFLAAGGTNDWLDGPGSINTSTTTKLFDLGSWHNLSGNLYGRNRAYPTANQAGRQQIYLEHRNFTQGLIYFLSNDPSVPAAIRNEWSRWGLPADEFTDNSGWPRRLYVRCARRMVSDYVITEADVRSVPTGTVIPAPAAPDPIGICYWPVDLHNARTVIKEGKVYNEGAYFDLGNYRPFGIPYRSIIPKRVDCVNLLVPSALSSSYAGYGAVRLEWTFMVLGQSAGIAAAVACDGDIAVQDVPYPTLRTLMLSRKQRLSLPAMATDGIIVDNSDTTGVTITGDWTTSTLTAGYQGINYIHDGNSGKGTKSVRFTPDIPSAGRYSVYTRWNSNSPRPDNVPVAITHAGGTANITINQQANGNQWNLLGSWNFAAGTAGSVLISNTGTTGYVIADAVRFVEEDEKPTVSIAASRAVLPENSSVPGKFVVTRTGTTASALTVQLSTGGSATAGADYTVLPASVTIPSGEASVSFNLSPLSDTVMEGAETVSVSIVPSASYTPDAGPAVITLSDPPFQRWKSDHFTANPAAGTSGASDDPDGDGNRNLIEFILGGDPLRNDTAETLPATALLKPDGGPSLDFSFWRRRDMGNAILSVRTSPDMAVWSDSMATGEVLEYDPAGDRIRVRYRFPVEAAKPNLFVRLQASGE